MTKKRTISHIIGDKAIDIVKSTLPNEWVIRPLSSDYGLDLLIELFDYVDKKKTICETLGEFIYAQVKGSNKLKKRMRKIHPVYNVAKSNWSENKNEFIEIEVVTYPIDTALLETVKKIGSSVCVLLIVVEVTTGDMYFICLNDVLDKYVQPQDEEYSKQKTISIPIPAKNKITGTYEDLVPLRLYGKRSKLYSAFSIIRYQLKELRYSSLQEAGLTLLFAKQLLQLDIWSIGNHLLALGICKIELDKLVRQITEGWSEDERKAMEFMNTQFLDIPQEEYEQQTLESNIVGVWEKLDNLSSIYEEVCREWFLPKFIGQLGSYPDTPDIRKSE